MTNDEGMTKYPMTKNERLEWGGPIWADLGGGGGFGFVWWV